MPLIHDDTLAGRAKVSIWAEWFKAALDWKQVYPVCVRPHRSNDSSPRTK
jgi:hypothetical protein